MTQTGDGSSRIWLYKMASTGVLSSASKLAWSCFHYGGCVSRMKVEMRKHFQVYTCSKFATIKESRQRKLYD